MSGRNIVSTQTFYILMPHKLEAYDNDLPDFLADDLMLAMQLKTTLIATDKTCLDNLQEAYPNYYRYEIRVGKL